MKIATRIGLLKVVAIISGIAATGFVVLGIVLIKAGAYPPPGTGSLGHVGMVVAGIVAVFLALFFGGLILVCASRRKVLMNAVGSDAGGSQPD